MVSNIFSIFTPNFGKDSNLTWSYFCKWLASIQRFSPPNWWIPVGSQRLIVTNSPPKLLVWFKYDSNKSQTKKKTHHPSFGEKNYLPPTVSSQKRSSGPLGRTTNKPHGDSPCHLPPEAQTHRIPSFHPATQRVQLFSGEKLISWPWRNAKVPMHEGGPGGVWFSLVGFFYI